MARSSRRDLPFGVVVVAFGFLLNALLFALFVARIRTGTELAQRVAGGTPYADGIMLLLTGLNVLAALLLLRRHPTGWVVAMLLVCVALGAYLVGWWFGVPEYPRMAIFSAMALYLNQREVRAAFAVQPSGPTDPGVGPVDDQAEDPRANTSTPG